MNFEEFLNEQLLSEMLVQREDGWHVISKHKGKNGKRKHLGGPYSHEAAVKRLRQIEYFKHQ
jgi:hypothetical protein